MKILITGGNGLLGKHLIETLKVDNQLYALVRHIPNIKLQHVTYVKVDLSSSWSYADLPESMDVIIHLAQSDFYKDFPNKAMDIFNVNISSTAKLLDYASTVGVKQFVYASSGGVYGNDLSSYSESIPVNINRHLGYYLGSKMCGEILAQNYMSLMKVSILRFFFMYGKGQKKSMLIPRLVDSVREGRSIALQGEDGLRINPIHVNDAGDAVRACIEKRSEGVFNIGGPATYSLREIGNLIGHSLGVEPIFIMSSGGSSELLADIEKMKTELHLPTMRLEEGIKSLINE